ncbi:4Fe-4S binding domain-containing protein [Humidesulfovibrio mexicanus]|uniref:4Fe-4S binding domain-containing protein n=1 Tax=Humidesulfovibrio mexicanus TaxID=147047 RepID=A0A238Z591_9BACT|nr:4Fe-4S binding protein [Humidesulfovibrio mexicanus]SNR77994.1 4Fe-4S binding domain-containing protein [Humidesulfovibrio mexicanus]
MNGLLLAVFRHRLYPRLIQAAGLLIYLGLIWFALGVFTPQGMPPKAFAQKHIVTLLLWGGWLPLTILATVFLGRIWCSICPLELVNRLGDRLGRTVFGKRASLPAALRGGMVSALLYSGLLVVTVSSKFIAVPHNAAVLLSLLLLAALATGFAFGGRAFCTAICPASMLFRLFGRRGMLALRVEAAKAPPAGDARASSARGRCPANLDPARLGDSSPCTLCAQCLKTGNGQDVRLTRAMPSTPDDNWEDYGWAATVFAFFFTGFALNELFQNWNTGGRHYWRIPSEFAGLFGIDPASGMVAALWSMLFVPAALWLLIGLAGRLSGVGASVKEVWKRLTLPLVSALVASQVVRAVTKSSQWLAGLPGAFEAWTGRLASTPWPFPSIAAASTTGGMGKAQGLAQGAQGKGMALGLLSQPVLLVVTLAVAVLFLWFAYCEAKALRRHGRGVAALSLVLSVLFLGLLVLSRLV